MSYNHWFVSRQKRQLTTILPAIVAFSDICVGKKWDTNLQLEYEDVLGKRDITEHGSLRARRAGQGGGGTRTLFKQMKDLGLVFLEEKTRICRLTLIAEELVSGRRTFVEAMRMQLKLYQYPSATSWSGSGSVDHSFKVHPFQFILRLLRDPRLNNYLSMEEMYGIVIHYAKSDKNGVFEDIVQKIIEYRDNTLDCFVADTEKKKYSNIANTFFNYLSLTQFIDRGTKTIYIRQGKEKDVDAFIEKQSSFIRFPEQEEIYQRKYGRGNARDDKRSFKETEALSKDKKREKRIREEYVLLALQTPITKITSDIVLKIVNKTGFDEKIVESFLMKNYEHGNIEDFFLSYKELAHAGLSGAKGFELATCEMFRKIFNMRAEHVGDIGNTPDVFVESPEYGYCGIIDNKSYKNGYSVSGDHKRVMEDVYIPNYKKYGKTTSSLAFFMYIAGSFGKNIDSQIATITKDTGINGAALQVDLLINLAQDYAENGYNHQFLKELFSVNREVRLSDLENKNLRNV